MNNNLTASLADNSAINGVSVKGFHQLTGAECKQMYDMKLLNAPAYILLIIKCHGKAGWKWTFTVKDFCRNWGLHERTFYRAVSKLKELNLLHWETKDTITVWHGTDIASEPDTGGSDTHDMSTNTLTPMAVSMTNVTVDVIPVINVIPLLSKEMVETLAIEEIEDAPDYIQTSSEASDSEEEESSPTVAPLGGAPMASELDEVEPELTEQEIRDELEAVNQGICPSIRALNQAFNTDRYNPAVVMLIKRRGQEFGLEIVDKQVQFME